MSLDSFLSLLRSPSLASLELACKLLPRIEIPDLYQTELFWTYRQRPLSPAAKRALYRWLSPRLSAETRLFLKTKLLIHCLHIELFLDEIARFTDLNLLETLRFWICWFYPTHFSLERLLESWSRTLGEQRFWALAEAACCLEGFSLFLKNPVELPPDSVLARLQNLKIHFSLQAPDVPMLLAKLPQLRALYLRSWGGGRLLPILAGLPKLEVVYMDAKTLAENQDEGQPRRFAMALFPHG